MAGPPSPDLSTAQSDVNRLKGDISGISGDLDTAMRDVTATARPGESMSNRTTPTRKLRSSLSSS